MIKVRRLSEAVARGCKNTQPIVAVVCTQLYVQGCRNLHCLSLQSENEVIGVQSLFNDEEEVEREGG